MYTLLASVKLLHCMNMVGSYTAAGIKSFSCTNMHSIEQRIGYTIDFYC